jgi:predicted alpha/beta hydrolase family esterase
MKNVIILHGTSETDQSFWYPWLTKELADKGYEVSIPTLPKADVPDIKHWLPAALKETYNEETVLIGHSAGCPLMLSVLENIDVKIKQAIFVAAYFEPVNPIKNILQPSYNWEKIKSHVEESIIINSDNDPWHCDQEQGTKLWKHIGGNLILRHGQGHMGSDTYHQPYKEFPFLLNLIA